jgi:hypothetical protein
VTTLSRIGVILENFGVGHSNHFATSVTVWTSSESKTAQTQSHSSELMVGQFDVFAGKYFLTGNAD